MTSPRAREIAGQPLRHPQSVGCGMARAHDRDARLGDRIHISAHIKDERRIVDLLQLRGIGGIIQADDGDAGRRNAPHFVVGQLHGLAGARATAPKRPESRSASSSVSEALKTLLHAAEMLDQPARPGGTQPRGQGKGQPLQGQAFAGFGTRQPGLPPLRPPPHRLTGGLYTSAKNDVKVTRHTPLLKLNIGRMKRLRISAISYLNTAPLMWDFEHGDAGRPSTFPILFLRNAPPNWRQGRRISASFRLRRMPAFRGLPSCPGWPSRRGARCARSFWSARFRWTRSARWRWILLLSPRWR